MLDVVCTISKLVCVYIYIYIYIYKMWLVFAIGLGDQGSITVQVIPKTQKIVLDTSLLNTQDY